VVLGEETKTQGKSSGNGKLAEEGLLNTFGGGSKTRVFVSPGKDILELAMRTVFDDDRQIMAAVMLYNKCHRFGIDRGLEDLKVLMAMKCSKQGRSTALALMAEIGILSPGVLTKGDDMRTLKRKGRQRDDDKPTEPA